MFSSSATNNIVKKAAVPFFVYCDAIFEFLVSVCAGNLAGPYLWTLVKISPLKMLQLNTMTIQKSSGRYGKSVV